MFWDVTPCTLVGLFADCMTSHPSFTYIGIPFQGPVHIHTICLCSVGHSVWPDAY